MKKIALALLLFASCATVPRQAPPVDTLQRAVDNTIALVDTDHNRFCSGVLAAGVAWTAFHCVVGEHEVLIELASGRVVRAEVVRIDVEHDLAVLFPLHVKLEGCPPLAAAPSKLGEDVYWTGYPNGNAFVLGKGSVSNERLGAPELGLADDVYFSVFGQIIPGNSGGPVFNQAGEVIGIMSSTMTGAFPFPQILPVGYIIRLVHLQAALDRLA